uniref:D-aspartate oxidase n=1 Tax=Cacopsylla melanoneura TaxID=428564 RepID=A0A8D8R5Z8_9HEMI
MGSNYKVAILGAGVVGLSTAIEFQSRFPSCELTLIADKFTLDTTSDGAAGLFDPSPSFMGPDFETTREWIKYSYEYYKGLLGADCGVNEISGYVLTHCGEKYSENHYLKPILPTYRRLSGEELADMSPGDWKFGSFLTTLTIANRIYQPWCMQMFKSRGGKIIQRHISSFSDLGKEFNFVFNCTGLGATALCDDIFVIPIRGQIIRIQDPSIDKFYMSDYSTYIVPNGYSITLGGTQQFGNYDYRVDNYDTESILTRCSRILPQVKTYNGPVESWVGLRPYRYCVRVEHEKTANVEIIHNYGHGGYGVTSAPGSARSAVGVFETTHKTGGKCCL